ncbi:MAG: ATPase domain-containing protein [Bryobacteraceae bacterium]
MPTIRPEMNRGFPQRRLPGVMSKVGLRRIPKHRVSAVISGVTGRNMSSGWLKIGSETPFRLGNRWRRLVQGGRGARDGKNERNGGQGYFRGSSILTSGTAGTGKTTLAAHFVDAACARGERCVFFSLEESANQIIRNMRSVGIDLARWVDKGLLHFQAARPTTYGLEMHLVKIHKTIKEINPSIVVVDPVTALLQSGPISETRSMLLRLVDFLKEKQITGLMTTLTSGSDAQEQTEVQISSLVDTWLLLRDIESGGERNRGIYILKARGIEHSNQIREFLLTDHGVELREVYLGEAGLLTGSARVTQEARDSSAAQLARLEIERKQLLLARKRTALDAQMAALQLELETEEQESRQLIAQEELKLKKLEQDRGEMAKSRFVKKAPREDNSRSTTASGGRK